MVYIPQKLVFTVFSVLDFRYLLRQSAFCHFCPSARYLSAFVYWEGLVSLSLVAVAAR